MLADNLIRSLNTKGYYAIGYADDICILITGKFENILCSLMQSALKIVEKWCKDTELSVNPFKTEMVLFTRKTKIEELKLPSLFGTSLSLSENVKYLGLILDKNLRWKAHFEAKIGKASIAFLQSRRAIGKSWGLNPQHVLWLYTVVVRPMFCYGAGLVASCSSQDCQRRLRSFTKASLS